MNTPDQSARCAGSRDFGSSEACADFAILPLTDVLPPDLARRVLAPLSELDITCADDLYECIGNLGGTWYRNAQGISQDDAATLTEWLAAHSKEVGEITARFYPPGRIPETLTQTVVDEPAHDLVPQAADFDAVINRELNASDGMGDGASIVAPESDDETPFDSAEYDADSLAPTISTDDADDAANASGGRSLAALTARLDAQALSGATGLNRARADQSALGAGNDLEAIALWLKARAANVNTLAQYKKEAERFLLWCTLERGKALSSITAEDAALYPTWLEELGRKEPQDWAQRWKLPQSAWIGPRNAPRLSAQWRPYNGPLSVSSRRVAMTIVRILFGFLVRTGYLRFNPFDQVSTKVHFLAGEGAPSAFADRSLTPRQWEEVTAHLEGLEDTAASRRMRVILSLGKGLGMRASEMINARAGWIVSRRIGDEDLMVIEIVGKGDKIRRLPIAAETLAAINAYFETRNLPPVTKCPADTPLLANLRGRAAREKKTTGALVPAAGENKTAANGISRSGLYRVLTEFFEAAALAVESKSEADAAKLRASSTHWLRHTFATTALKAMDINIVQNAMGHASIGTTSRYLTPEESQIAQAMKRMKPL